MSMCAAYYKFSEPVHEKFGGSGGSDYSGLYAVKHTDSTRYGLQNDRNTRLMAYPIQLRLINYYLTSGERFATE